LCPTDWSAPSRAALRVAVNMARFEGAELRLLHVLPPLGTVRGLASAASLGEAVEHEASQKLAAMVAELAAPNVRVTPLLRVGRASHEIFEAATECDVVVMSAHGRAGWARWALGSVAEKVLRETACPVFVVGPDALPARTGAVASGLNPSVDFLFKQVLWATDWSLPAECALDEAIALARRHGAQLLLLHVSEPPIPPGLATADWDAEQSAEAAVCFGALCERHPGAGGARRLISRGDAAAEIVRVSRLEGADLIVMGTHGRTGWKRSAVGSVAQEVVRLVPCPVLLVPPDAAANARPL